MTPDERQLLSGLFDRMNGAAGQPRDREAESFITDRVRSQPYAPYLLSQTVIVQEQALRAAADRIQQLEAQVQSGGASQQPQEETSFLGSLGKSIFGAGAGAAASSSRQPAPQQGGYGQQQGGGYAQQGGGYGQGGYGNAPGSGNPAGPWGQSQGNYGVAAPQQAAPQGGGFLKGALGAAAGVAGGVLAADALRGLFGGHNNPFGIASGGGLGGAGGGGETIVNNYYDNPDQGGGDLAQQDAQQDFLQDQGDDFADNSFDPGSNGDDSYNV